MSILTEEQRDELLIRVDERTRSNTTQLKELSDRQKTCNEQVESQRAEIASLLTYTRGTRSMFKVSVTVLSSVIVAIIGWFVTHLSR